LSNTTNSSNKQHQQQTLTGQDHWNTDETGCGGTDQSQKPGPSTTRQLPVHQEDAYDVGRDFCCSGQERVDVSIAVQRSSVERNREVNQTNRKPAHSV